MPSSAVKSASLYTTRNLLRDIRPFLLPYKWKFIIATLFRLASDISWLYPVYGLAVLVTFFTKYTPDASLAPVKQVFLFWGLAVVVRTIGTYVAKQTMYAVGEQMSLDAQLKTIGHLFLLDMEWHEHENSGNKLKKIQRGGDSVDQILRRYETWRIFLFPHFAFNFVIKNYLDIRLVGDISFVGEHFEPVKHPLRQADGYGLGGWFEVGE